MSDSSSRAAKARELITSRGFAILATASARRPGFPFGSIVNYAVDDRGRPLFLLSALAVHSKNLAEEARASLVVFHEDAERDPLTSPRLTLMGNVVPVGETEEEAAREAYLGRHPESAEYLEFGDFAFYRMDVVDLYYVAGFGEMGWIGVSDYEAI